MKEMLIVGFKSSTLYKALSKGVMIEEGEGKLHYEYEKNSATAC